MDFFKCLHVSCALISIVLFLIRGIWMINESKLLSHRLTKVVPHINDSVLLASALTLLLTYGINPLTMPWLMAKISALLIYISLGLVAFRFGKTKTQKIVAWVLALLVVSYIVQTALTKNPWVFDL